MPVLCVLHTSCANEEDLMRIRILCCSFRLSVLVLAGSAFLFSQSQQPGSDPQAVSLATQAMTALMNGVAVGDVTLSGDAVWTSGTNTERGTATAYGKKNADSRLDLALSNGKRSELRNSAGGSPQGAWIKASGQSTPSAFQNCWTDAVWFFPALTSLSAVNSDPTLVLVYLGLETQNGRSVQHIQSYHYIASKVPKATNFTQQISTVDYYLDAQTLVPMSITFDAHPDDGTDANIAVQVDFANYQLANGILVPFHVTKLWQGNTLLDFTVTNVAVNSGLPDSLFSIQ
jgi:hypothetical protein